MKKLLALFVVLLVFTACNNKETNLVVSGNIEGLKKGTLYLQKIEDTILINVDSLVIKGDSRFVLEDYISSPQIMYLYLDKIDNTDYGDRIEFFAEEGEIIINTTL